MQPSQQRTIDRSNEFDQDREHDHRPGVVCSCGMTVPPIVAAEIAQITSRKPNTVRVVECFCGKGTIGDGHTHGVLPTSPAIWEQRYLQEKQKTAALQAELDATGERLDVALERIAGYERLNETLAAKADETIAELARFAGTELTDMLAPAKPAAENTEKHIY